MTTSDEQDEMKTAEMEEKQSRVAAGASVSGGLASPPRPAEGEPEAETMTTRNLKVSFGKTDAVKGVDMEIRARSVTAIIGPSGCGKTTYLRALNRMHDYSPSARVSGTVLLGDRDIYGDDMSPVELRTRVGMVFQRPNPFPTMSIRDNITFAPRRHGRVRRGEMGELVERVLRQAALWDEVKDRLDDSAIGLSGGQQQRLCIARALAVKPGVILMDEPASALDPTATQRIEELIYDLKKHYTIVIVTHNMQQAARVSDYTAFFYVGNLVEFGETDQVFTNPREERTEAYITGRFG